MPESSNNHAMPFRTTRMRTAGHWLAVLAWYGLIFAASSRPDLRVSDDDLLDFVLRKLAHALVFGVLALLVARAVSNGRCLRTRHVLIAWLATLVLAIADEWHQTFVHGRVGHPSDVLIDMTGATLALIGTIFIQRRRSATQTRELP